MRMLLAALISAFSFTAFASSESSSFHHHNHYAGKGVWKDLQNNRGTFTETLDKQNLSDTSFKLAGQVKIDGGDTFTWTSTVQITNNGIFHILDEAGQIQGEGYCFFGQTCHVQISKDDMTMEETMHFKGHHMYIIGSKSFEGNKVMYTADLIGKHNR